MVLHIENHGPRPARLRARLSLERHEEAGWAPAETFAMRVDCGAEEVACLTLAPGGELRLPLGVGQGDERRCGCDPCSTPSAGKARLVVESCPPEGHVALRIASAPFDL